MSKRIVFLLGAGAALDWGGPRTICNRDGLATIPEHRSGEIKDRPCCLTHLIRAIGFKNEKGERITEVIYRLLVKAGRTPNFESIINILDDLYTYYALRSAQKNREDAGLASIFAFEGALDDLSFFTTEEDSPVTHSYTLHIPGNDILTEKYIPSDVSPHMKYFEFFLNGVFGVVIAQISKYAYHNERQHSMVFEEVNNKVNKDFYNWIDRVKGADCIIRMYTLNYDQIFKILLEEKGMDVFEGFDTQEGSYEYGCYPVPNLRRILTDEATHCFYNLHGSAYWEAGDNERLGFTGYQYHRMPIGIIEKPGVSIEIEKGKSILLSSIITGYQKVQRTAISPFRQLFAAFDRDCIIADEIYIVGYSFGDEHVNDIIRNAKKTNQKIKVTIIDPGFNDEQFFLKFIAHWGPVRTSIFQNGSDNEIISEHYRLRIIQKRFGDFLSGNALEQFGNTSW